MRLWVRINLHLYFGKIKVSGLENIPTDAPVLFLPNHQNALLDVLLIGIDCNRDPWFLTRSDVFKKKTLSAFFDVLQMIPIYRIRDGRESLKNNQEVFDRCAELLCQKEAVIMFPEGNHNLQRRVRSLSKGFTRIIFQTLRKAPDIDIQIIPVGLNYKNAVRFPDRVALYFGIPISVKELYNAEDEKGSVDQMKKAVSDQLKTLTTHIKDEVAYNTTIQELNKVGVDFLNPKDTNAQIKNLEASNEISTIKSIGTFSKIATLLFTLLNLPLVLIWRILIKPKVPEQEFMGTFRFGFTILVGPLYYLLLFFTWSMIFSPMVGLYAVAGLFLFNLIYVKMS